MEEDFKVIDNYLMVKMPEEVDHHKSGVISKTADKYIINTGVGNVVFDFEDTRFMDSSGIGIILGRYKKIACFGGKVFAINADSRIKRTLMICGLHKVIEILE
ncbi:MAG: anti-sigma factor antagonist [Lachnospiraceae bacterium]|nr:anti-sigma factor antagonist [Lachnospiraceae bacterium]